MVAHLYESEGRGYLDALIEQIGAGGVHVGTHLGFFSVLERRLGEKKGASRRSK